jgi:hypothetical protein
MGSSPKWTSVRPRLFWSQKLGIGMATAAVVLWLATGEGAFAAGVFAAFAVWYVALWVLFPWSSFAQARLLPTDKTFGRYRAAARPLQWLPGAKAGADLSSSYEKWVAAERQRLAERK